MNVVKHEFLLSAAPSENWNTIGPSRTSNSFDLNYPRVHINKSLGVGTGFILEPTNKWMDAYSEFVYDEYIKIHETNTDYWDNWLISIWRVKNSDTWYWSSYQDLLKLAPSKTIAIGLVFNSVIMVIKQLQFSCIQVENRKWEKECTFSPERAWATKWEWSQRVVDLVSRLRRRAPPASTRVLISNPRAALLHPLFSDAIDDREMIVYAGSISRGRRCHCSVPCEFERFTASPCNTVLKFLLFFPLTVNRKTTRSENNIEETFLPFLPISSKLYFFLKNFNII